MVKEITTENLETAANDEAKETVAINETIRDLNRQVEFIVCLLFSYQFCRECLTNILGGHCLKVVTLMTAGFLALVSGLFIDSLGRTMKGSRFH